ncbi:hypothetical protein VJ923_05970 [Adlercreutzia sp. R25]|uniref:Uncharacterized protein n=1 Tax=Adlercreutzia shanghongiae TaxID=3111773 RepID=A0ABU6IX77_9ACTN|nr:MULTISPECIES: hypothetical protein [unclassified Adlercreutzia]MEC4272700.1 hypothetical protein [Adlercreutzia sp. R25]MEC4294400.1 hypothetical protein [Adlercreutzia sp. R22]
MRVVEFVRNWGGFLFGLCGFLWWLGITPENVGQAVYDASYWIVPPLLLGCGVWIGWSLKTRQMEKEGIASRNMAARKHSSKEIAAFCSVMSKRKKAILLEALENGEVVLSPVDPDACSLGDMDLLKTSPVGFRTLGTSWFVNPEHIATLKKHRGKWLGDIEKSDRLKVIGIEQANY